MITTENEINNTQNARSWSNKHLSSLNPLSYDFNFELWAQEVARQMKAALGKQSNSHQIDKSE